MSPGSVEHARAPVVVDFQDYASSIPAALDALGAPRFLHDQKAVMLKPNLVNTSPFPVTTPVEVCAVLVDYIRAHGTASVVIAEGTGDASRETDAIFAALGYTKMARDKDVQLLDLNHAPSRRIPLPRGRVFKELHLPEVAFTHFLISVPVLKAHSLAGITGALKNLMGLLPPRHYGNPAGGWKKSRFHARMQGSLMDLCACRAPDLAVMDASVGLADYHLGGPILSPPAGKIIAGRDAWEVDRLAAGLLGLEWRDIEHLNKVW